MPAVQHNLSRIPPFLHGSCFLLVNQTVTQPHSYDQNHASSVSSTRGGGLQTATIPAVSSSRGSDKIDHYFGRHIKKPLFRPTHPLVATTSSANHDFDFFLIPFLLNFITNTVFILITNFYQNAKQNGIGT